VRQGWDPEGLFSKGGSSTLPAGTDFFALREQRRQQQQQSSTTTPQQQQSPSTPPTAAAQPAQQQQQQQQQQGPPPLAQRKFAEPIQPITPEQLAAGGVDISQPQFEQQRNALAQRLAESYMPLQIDRPGVRVMSWDPPVVVVEDFLSTEECEGLISTADKSGGVQFVVVGA